MTNRVANTKRIVNIAYVIAFTINLLIGQCLSQKVVQHSCNAVAGNANLVRVIVRIVPNTDPIFKVYGFNASVGDTTSSQNRIDACVYDTTGITNAIEITVDVDITATTHSCGAHVTDMTTYQRVSLLFRVYAYSDTMISIDDDSWSVQCRSDDLTGTTVSSQETELSSADVITVMEPQTAAYLRLRHETTFRPATVATVGDRVLLSVEFSPVLEKGPDSYGTHFFVGFLGNDPISATSSSDLYVEILPRYNRRADITVTSGGTSQEYESDGAAIQVQFSADFMGCAGDGEAVVEDLGIEIRSYIQEISVLVCNNEADSADCYTALPTDVTGTEYVTVSMPSANDASELMVIAQEDGTLIDLTVPTGVSHSVLFNGATTTGGNTVQIPLNKGQTVCLAQTTTNADTSHVTGYHIASNNPVSVIGGNWKYENDHMADMMMPVSKLQSSYVLIPANAGDGRATTYIIQAVNTGNTVVTRYLTAATFETFTITPSTVPPLTIDVASDSPCELTASQPVIVALVVNNQQTNQGFEHAMVVVPSVQQWAPRYTFFHRNYSVTTAMVRQSLSTSVTVQAGDTTTFSPTLPSEITVNGPNNYVFTPGISLPSPTKYTLYTADTSNMMAVCLATKSTTPKNIGLAFLPFGYRYSDKDQCYPVGHRGDLLDNDCDGRIDEELLDQIDNDGDGAVDEDTGAGTTETAGVVAIRPTNCRVSGDPAFTTSVQITGADGCAVTGSSGPFLPDAEFTPQSWDNIGSGTLHKVLFSGLFELAMFIDQPKLYFMCDIAKYCYTDADTDCTTNICQSGTAKRAATEVLDNVTTNVWVFPYRSKQDVKNQTVLQIEEATIKACFDNASIRVIFSLLLLLSLLTFCTSLCFCFLFRRKNNREKPRKQYIDNVFCQRQRFC